MIDVELDGRNLEVELGGMTFAAPFDIELDNGSKVITGDVVHINTTAFWNEHVDFIGHKNHIYIYSDYDSVDGESIPAMKVSDGLGYLIDQPFVTLNASLLMNHIRNTEIHITQYEREFWNNKVRCEDSEILDGENLIFTTM